MTIASRAAGQKSQYWAKAQKGEAAHGATSTVDFAPDWAGEAIDSASLRADTSNSLLDLFTPTVTARSPQRPLDIPDAMNSHYGVTQWSKQTQHAR